jgi:hypothetical protein
MAMEEHVKAVMFPPHKLRESHSMWTTGVAFVKAPREEKDLSTLAWHQWLTPIILAT